jgi:hypothetical protein
MGITSKPKLGGGLAEDYDVREYRPGDPVNLIHWKLTSKRDDDVMIREPLVTERGKALLTFDLYGDPTTIGKTFGCLTWCVLWLLNYSVQPYIRWYDNQSDLVRTAQVSSFPEFYSLLVQIFSSRVPLTGKSVAGEDYDDYTWRYHISAKIYGTSHERPEVITGE